MNCLIVFERMPDFQIIIIVIIIIIYKGVGVNGMKNKKPAPSKRNECRFSE